MDATAVLPDPIFVEEPDLHEQDPSQKDGFTVVYDKECPFEMRMQEHDESPQEVGTLEAIRCRVCVQGDVASPTAVVRDGIGIVLRIDWTGFGGERKSAKTAVSHCSSLS